MRMGRDRSEMRYNGTGRDGMRYDETGRDEYSLAGIGCDVNVGWYGGRLGGKALRRQGKRR